MRLILIALLLVTGNSFLHAQVRYFFQAEGNLSLLPKIKNNGTYVNTFAANPNQSVINSSTTFKHKPGFNVSGGAQVKLSKYLAIEASAGIRMLTYRQKNKYHIITTDGTNYTESKGTYYHAGITYPAYIVQSPSPGVGYSPYVPDNQADASLQKKQGNANLGFASLVAVLKLNLTEKTSIGIGPSLDFLLWAKAYNDKMLIVESPLPDYVYVWAPKTEKASIKKDLTNIGASGHIQLEHQLTDQFALQAAFSQAINKLYKDQEMTLSGGKARMRYVSIGVRYYLQ